MHHFSISKTKSLHAGTFSQRCLKYCMHVFHFRTIWNSFTFLSWYIHIYETAKWSETLPKFCVPHYGFEIKWNFFHMKTLLKMMVKKGPFDSQVISHHHILIGKISQENLAGLEMKLSSQLNQKYVCRNSSILRRNICKFTSNFDWTKNWRERFCLGKNQLLVWMVL